MLVDLGTKRLGRPEKRVGETMGGFVVVDPWCGLDGHMAEFVSEREALAFAPIALVDVSIGRVPLV